MSADGEKRFDAPPSRIAKARREGNLPRASELAGNVAFAAAVLACAAAAGPLGGTARAALAAAARGERPGSATLFIVAWALVPIAAACSAAAGVSLVQSGGLVFLAPAPKFERLQPAEGVKRMFSRESAAQAVRACVVFGLAALSTLPALRGLLAAAATSLAPASVAAIAWSGAQHAVGAVAGIGVLFGIAEFAAARRAWRQKLRMSYAELKREMKENDGDPLARGRRRALHRSFARGSIAQVKEAAFVLVNPTHVAVALAYAPPEIPVPTILVRAADERALRVRELAASHGVPVVENVSLARALFADGSVGAPIPHEYYVAVAEVVAALLKSGVLG